MMQVPTNGTMAASGMGGMLAIVLVWLLGLFHVEMPMEVAIALASVLIGAFGFIVHSLPPERVREAQTDLAAVADAIALARKGS